MRRVFAVFVCLFLLWPIAARADQTSAAVITAQQIALFSDRSLLIADGGVSVHMTGLQITATRAGYDLRANTLIATGDVSVTNASGTSSGAGYTYDFKSHTGRFSTVLTVPQIASAEAVAVSQQVELRPAQSIAFSNAQVRSGSVLTPVAAYTYTIPPPTAKDFGYSPVPSAALDYSFLLTHGADAYSFARARYDRYNGGPGAGLEEHYARTDRGYVALGETMDVNYGRIDLAAYQRINDSYSQTLTGSTYPDTRSLRYALSTSGRHGFASLSIFQFDGTRTDDLYVAGNQRSIAHIGTLRLQADFAHDVHPYDYSGAQDFRVVPGFNFNSAGLRVGSATVSTSVDVAESIYNYGRGTLHTSQTFWGTFPATARLIFTGGATFSHDAPPFPATYRTYTVGGTWRASHAFNLVSSLTYTHDYAQAFQFGRPIFSAAFNVRLIRRNGTGVEIGAILPFGGVGNMERQSAFNLRFFRE
jgi:hypothetical protein